MSAPSVIPTISVHMHCTACGGRGLLGGKPCHCQAGPLNLWDCSQCGHEVEALACPDECPHCGDEMVKP
jgi:hypothetical protein